MIISLFLNNINIAIKLKKHIFIFPYNIKIFLLIKKFIDLNIILKNEIKLINNKKYFICYFNLFFFINNQINIINLTKKTKHQPYSKKKILNILKKNKFLIFSTSIGLKTSFECIKYNIGGVPFCQIKF